MDPPRLTCTLVVRGGLSRRVGQCGVLIGRQHDCDLVVSDPSASRRHALIRITSEGVEVIPLGREPVLLNGRACDKTRTLAHGDELALPGLTLSVELDARAALGEALGGFVLERARGGSFGIVHTPFVIGGAPSDDLIVKAWPEALFRIHLAQGELFVELRAGTAELDGESLEVGVLAPIAVGGTLTCREEAFTVRRVRGQPATTAVTTRAELPVRVVSEMLPRGGRLVFSTPMGDRAVYLPDRRFDLMMALLRPPGGCTAGEFVSDEVLRGLVWPRSTGVSRQEINTLISRCRRDLVDAGLAGPRLIERAPGGGGTRINLAPNAEVIVVG